MTIATPQKTPGKAAEGIGGVQGLSTPAKSPRRPSESRRGTLKASRRLVAMAQAAASATVGAPVDWAGLSEAQRRIFVDVALAVHEADRIAP